LDVAQLREVVIDACPLWHRHGVSVPLQPLPPRRRVAGLLLADAAGPGAKQGQRPRVGNDEKRLGGPDAGPTAGMTVNLPSMPATRVPVLIYDGDCGFCTSVAADISRRWRVPATAMAWQSLGEGGLAELGLTPESAQRAAWWVDGDGRQFRGHLAVARALVAAHGWRRVIGGAIAIPPVSWAAALGYRLVVRCRHRLPGSTRGCSASSPPEPPPPGPDDPHSPSSGASSLAPRPAGDRRRATLTRSPFGHRRSEITWFGRGR